MHHELSIYEIKTVRFCVPRIFDYLLFQLIPKMWNLIYLLPSIGTVWDAKSEFEIEGLDQLITEKVAFDHLEIWYWYLPDCKGYSSSDGF